MFADEFYDIDWSDKADGIINRICANLGLGAEVPARKNAQGDAINPLSKLGYNVCKQYGDILIGYHKVYEYMGIIVQLSGMRVGLTVVWLGVMMAVCQSLCYYLLSKPLQQIMIICAHQLELI